MTDADQPEITANLPDSPFHTTGTDHITIIGSNEDDTLEFYRDTLGMPLVLKQPNLDDPSQSHLFFDTGDGVILTVFVKPDRESNSHQHPQIGAVHHLCFSLDPDRFEEVADSLGEHGHHYSVFDRGIFLSLYTTDHNGLTIELTVEKFEFPQERKGEVYAETQRIREQEGAEYADTHHMEEALETLGIDYERNEFDNYASGTANL